MSENLGFSGFNSGLSAEEEKLVLEMTDHFWKMAVVVLMKKLMEKDGNEIAESMISIWKQVLSEHFGQALQEHDKLAQKFKNSEYFQLLKTLDDIDGQKTAPEIPGAADMHLMMDTVLYESEALIRKSLGIEKNKEI